MPQPSMKCLCGESIRFLFIFPGILQCVMVLRESLRQQDVFVKIFFFSSPHLQPSVEVRQPVPMRMDPEARRRPPVLLEHSVQSNEMGAHHFNASFARRRPHAK